MKKYKALEEVINQNNNIIIQKWSKDNKYIEVQCLDEHFLILDMPSLVCNSEDVQKVLNCFPKHTIPTEKQWDMIYILKDKINTYMDNKIGVNLFLSTSYYMDRYTSSGNIYAYNIPYNNRWYKNPTRPKHHICSYSSSNLRFIVNLNG